MLVEYSCIAAVPAPEVTLPLRCSYIYQFILILQQSITIVIFQSSDRGSESSKQKTIAINYPTLPSPLPSPKPRPKD
jgi:hypothetical protein